MMQRSRETLRPVGVTESTNTDRPYIVGMCVVLCSYLPRITDRRIIHIDLKGAPPIVDYFIAYVRLIKRLGGTGVLIEWEDTFPYDGAACFTRFSHYA